MRRTSMYRTRINKVFANTYENLLDAKKEALLSNKKDNTLVEVLDDEDNVIFTKGELVGEPFGAQEDMVGYPIETPTEEIKDNGVDSSIRNLIVATWNSIDEVNSTLVTLDTMGLLDVKISEALNIILDDLNTHVGLLEGCLSNQEVD